jgi:hypothetical protein
MSTPTKYKGVPLDFGTHRLIVPGLSLRQLRENKDLVATCIALEAEAAAGGKDVLFKMLDPVASLVHMALQRNYPAVTKAKVEDVLDTNNMTEYVTAIMGQSGLVRVSTLPEGEMSGEGEAPRSSPSTGADSTGS